MSKLPPNHHHHHKEEQMTGQEYYCLVQRTTHKKQIQFISNFIHDINTNTNTWNLFKFIKVKP